MANNWKWNINKYSFNSSHSVMQKNEQYICSSWVIDELIAFGTNNWIKDKDCNATDMKDTNHVLSAAYKNPIGNFCSCKCVN